MELLSNKRLAVKQGHFGVHHVVIGDEVRYSVLQEADATSVMDRRTGKTVALPHKRYSLATDRPANGGPGRLDFERDLLAIGR